VVNIFKLARNLYGIAATAIRTSAYAVKVSIPHRNCLLPREDGASDPGRASNMPSAAELEKMLHGYPSEAPRAPEEASIHKAGFRRKVSVNQGWQSVMP
jgi:hypothetical protein